MDILYTVTADQIEVGDFILIEGDPIEVKRLEETDDLDEVVVIGYSHETGDSERDELYADDEFGVWGA